MIIKVSGFPPAAGASPDGQPMNPVAEPELSLRQMLQRPTVADPKIHDITEKFTKACNGWSTFSLLSLSCYHRNLCSAASRIIHRIEPPLLYIFIKLGTERLQY